MESIYYFTPVSLENSREKWGVGTFPLQYFEQWKQPLGSY